MNGEAIKKLKDILEEVTETDDSVCYVTSDDTDALKAAIQALEQQPCEDCVKREPIQKAIKDMLRWINSGNRGNADYFIVDQIEEIIAELNIDNLPSVTPEPFINKPCISEGVCREDKIKVLDKIRSELIQSIQNGTLKIESGNEELFHIIDKYKKEIEDNE